MIYKALCERYFLTGVFVSDYLNFHLSFLLYSLFGREMCADIQH